MDYSKIVIYKIQHKINKNLFYIGSTTGYINRRTGHKNYWKIGNSDLYLMIRENGGWSDFHMSVVKDFPCKNGLELFSEKCKVHHKEEMQVYLEKIKEIVNPIQVQ